MSRWKLELLKFVIIGKFMNEFDSETNKKRKSELMEALDLRSTDQAPDFIKPKKLKASALNESLEITTGKGDQAKSFPCDQCARSFATKTGLRTHTTKAHKDQDKTDEKSLKYWPLNKCQICDDHQCKTVNELKNHYVFEHMQNFDTKFRCKFCFTVFKNLDELHKHKKALHSEVFFYCNIGKCTGWYKSASPLVNHWVYDELGVRVQCPKCAALFSSVSQMDKHKRDCNGNGEMPPNAVIAERFVPKQVVNDHGDDGQDDNDKPVQVKHENLEYLPKSTKDPNDKPVQVKHEHMEYLPRSSKDLNDKPSKSIHCGKNGRKRIKKEDIEHMEYLSVSIKDEEDEQAVKDTDEVLEYMSPKSEPPDTPKAEPTSKRQKMDNPGDLQDDRKCRKCHLTIRGDLTTHYVMEHLNMDSALYCEICATEFYTYEQKLKHQKMVHRGIYMCPDDKCKITFTMIYTFIEHLLEVHLGLVFKCNPCDEVKHSPDALIKHKKIKHSPDALIKHKKTQRHRGNEKGR